jgi:hypothetical protein
MVTPQAAEGGAIDNQSRCACASRDESARLHPSLRPMLRHPLRPSLRDHNLRLSPLFGTEADGKRPKTRIAWADGLHKAAPAPSQCNIETYRPRAALMPEGTKVCVMCSMRVTESGVGALR